jgi:m7GpppX diphosphatase
MSHPAAPTSLDKLISFDFERVLNEDPATHSLIVLGSFPGVQGPDSPGERVRAIIRIEKTALHRDEARTLFAGKNALVKRVALEESTDIVCTMFTASINNRYWKI